MYVHVCACMCMYVHVCMCMYVCACMYVHVWACMYVHACMCMHVCMCMYGHVCACMYVHACMCMHVCACRDSARSNTEVTEGSWCGWGWCSRSGQKPPHVARLCGSTAVCALASRDRVLWNTARARTTCWFDWHVLSSRSRTRFAQLRCRREGGICEGYVRSKEEGIKAHSIIIEWINSTRHHAIARQHKASTQLNWRSHSLRARNSLVGMFKHYQQVRCIRTNTIWRVSREARRS